MSCESCEGTGIFYFTKDHMIEDSQMCGKCNGTGQGNKRFGWQRFPYYDHNIQVRNEKLLRLFGARYFAIEEICCWEFRLGQLTFSYAARPFVIRSLKIPIPFLRTDLGVRFGKGSSSRKDLKL